MLHFHFFRARSRSTYFIRAHSNCCSGLLALMVTWLPVGCGANSRPVSEPPVSEAEGPGTAAIDEAGGVPKDYRVVWADEFDVDGLPDPKRWDYDTYRNSACDDETRE